MRLPVTFKQVAQFLIGAGATAIIFWFLLTWFLGVTLDLAKTVMLYLFALVLTTMATFLGYMVSPEIQRHKFVFLLALFALVALGLWWFIL